jgi:hypothetical protein
LRAAIEKLAASKQQQQEEGQINRMTREEKDKEESKELAESDQRFSYMNLKPM